MHEDDSTSEESGPAPAGPPGDSLPPAMASTGSPAPPRPRLPSPHRGLLVYLVVAILAAAAGVGTTLAVRHPGLSSASTAWSAGDAAAGRFGTMNDETVYNEVEPGIVDVDANLQYLNETAEGTGFVINAAAGLVLTNNHVIDGATSVTVTAVMSGKRYHAKILGYDRSDDVALLQLPDTTGLKAVTIGDSSDVTVGTSVLAIGNEAGQGGSPTVAPGVISSLDRTIKASDQTSGETETLYGMLQTNADIRPGDSGGPLADAAGQVIGLDTAAGGATVYSGYAIPVKQALSIASRIAARQASPDIQIGVPGFLGALVSNSRSTSPQLQASQQKRQTGGVSSARSSCINGAATTVPAHIAPARSGALVDGVLCGTVAATAGLFAGDVITSIDGRAVSTPSSLTGILSRYRPGRAVSLAWVSPGGSLHTALITLGTGPAQ
ncbi:MAG: S1C family serine protease [Actinomycetota bacterium]|nr:S1C family serine protease [Actinomycetota bacterium]